MSEELKRKIKATAMMAMAQTDENKRVIAVAAQLIEIGEETAKAAIEREKNEAS